MHSVYYSGKRVVVAVIQLVTLGRHSGMPHDNVGIFVNMQVNFVSSVRALVNCKFAIMIKCVSGCISSALLALLGEHAKQLLTLLRIKGMVVIYQAENCTHINRPPLS